MLLSCYHGEESELCGILCGLIECHEDEKYTKDDQEASSLSAPSVPEGTRSGLLSPALDLLYLEQAGGVAGGSYLCPQIPVLNRKLVFLPKTWNLRNGTGLAYWTQGIPSDFCFCFPLNSPLH